MTVGNDVDQGKHVSSVGTHFGARERVRLLEGVGEMRKKSLDERWAMAPGSPVAVLDRLLRQRRDEVTE